MSNCERQCSKCESRRKTIVSDAICMINLKWNWAAHLARKNDNKWTKSVRKIEGLAGGLCSAYTKNKKIDSAQIGIGIICSLDI